MRAFFIGGPMHGKFEELPADVWEWVVSPMPEVVVSFDTLPEVPGTIDPDERIRYLRIRPAFEMRDEVSKIFVIESMVASRIIQNVWAVEAGFPTLDDWAIDCPNCENGALVHGPTWAQGAGGDTVRSTRTCTYCGEEALVVLPPGRVHVRKVNGARG